MALSARSRFVLVLGVAMVALGIFVALRPLISPGDPITQSMWLDMAFAAFFILRGWMNVRTARRKRPVPPGSERNGQRG